MRRLGRAARERAIGEVLERWRASREPKGAFCRREGIASVTLTRWLRKFDGDSQSAARSRRAFVEVRPAEVRCAAGFEVEFPGGVTLRVPAGFEAGDLSRLLSALRPTC
jgi:hypothetical protein